MATVTQIGPRLGIAPTCAALGLPRATYYRRRRPPQAAPPRRAGGVRDALPGPPGALLHGADRGGRRREDQLRRRVDRGGLRHRALEGGDPAGHGDPARLPPARARRTLADLRRGGRLDKPRRELPDAVRPRDPLGVLQRAARAAAEEDPGHRRGGAPAGVLRMTAVCHITACRDSGWSSRRGRSATLATRASRRSS